MKRFIAALLFFVTIIFSGCSSWGAVACIDWVDFVKFNDISYSNLYNGAVLDESAIDKEYAKVSHKVADNVSDPNYKTKNGDAAFLEKGTQIYTLKGYNPSFRLAAIKDGKVVIYEADYNPKAKTGKDILDIKGKVKYISINSETDGTTELGRIEDKKLVDKLVDMVLEGNLSDDGSGDGQRYFICFQLEDGSKVNRAYWKDSGKLSRNINVSNEFGEEISKALKK